MSTQAHTPGPWRVDPKAALRIVAAGNDTVASAGCQSSLRNEWEANAHLIAAAPDLLAALKAFVAAGDGHYEFEDKWLAAHAAITKAEAV